MFFKQHMVVCFSAFGLCCTNDRQHEADISALYNVSLSFLCFSFDKYHLRFLGFLLDLWKTAWLPVSGLSSCLMVLGTF